MRRQNQTYWNFISKIRTYLIKNFHVEGFHLIVGEGGAGATPKLISFLRSVPLPQGILVGIGAKYEYEADNGNITLGSEKQSQLFVAFLWICSSCVRTLTAVSEAHFLTHAINTKCCCIPIMNGRGNASNPGLSGGSGPSSPNVGQSLLDRINLALGKKRQLSVSSGIKNLIFARFLQAKKSKETLDFLLLF